MAEIRLARPEDLDGILQVGWETWHSTYVPLAGEAYVREGLARWWTAERTLPSIAEGRVWVAEVDGRIVGMSMHGIKDRTADLWKLYVRPEHQGHGLGRALLHAVLEDTRGAVDRVVLAYMDGNEAARGFYERMGFVATHREADRLGGPDNLWMELSAEARNEALRRWNLPGGPTVTPP